jgi:predicted nucleotidyltransferase
MGPSSDAIDKIAEKYGIKLLIYFGSYQTEYFNRDSDIDIAFLSSGALDPEQRYRLLEELIIFHRKSEIDLVDLKKADPVLRYEIAVHGKVFYEQETNLFDRYALFYIKRYYELKPVIQEEMKQIQNIIKEVLHDAG